MGRRHRNPVRLTPPSNKCLYEALNPRMWVDVGRYCLRATWRRLAASWRILT